MEKFFTDIFRLLRQGTPSMYGTFLQLMEQEFKREGYREKFSSSVENILIVQIDAIGDMIVMSGMIREVRKNFPQARITLVCSPLVYPLVELCPYVNEVLTFDLKTLEGQGRDHTTEIFRRCWKGWRTSVANTFGGKNSIFPSRRNVTATVSPELS